MTTNVAAQRALILDKDGVLCDYDYQALESFFRAACGHSVTDVYGALVEYGYDYDYSQLLEDDAESILWESFCEHFQRETDLDADAYDALMSFNHLEHLVAFDDAGPVLRQLRQGGFLITVLTENPMNDPRGALATVSLDGYVDHVESCARLKRRKTEAEVYSVFLGLVNRSQNTTLTLDDCIFVDDQTAHVATAREAGVGLAVCLDRRGQGHDLAARCISDLWPLLDVLG